MAIAPERARCLRRLGGRAGPRARPAPRGPRAGRVAGCRVRGSPALEGRVSTLPEDGGGSVSLSSAAPRRDLRRFHELCPWDGPGASLRVVPTPGRASAPPHGEARGT